MSEDNIIYITHRDKEYVVMTNKMFSHALITKDPAGGGEFLARMQGKTMIADTQIYMAMLAMFEKHKPELMGIGG
ncbi:hypothetical protein D4R42_04685 [bacterium]|nr:MAG: hypothetical protein D4R42_04685 [bacterium]